MGNFNRERGENKFGNRSGGRDRRGGFGGGRRRDFGRDRQMHKAICADCGNPCEVPFRPSGDKPVLCSSCFSGEAPKRTSQPYQSAQSAQSSEKHDEIIAKLDKIISLLQRTNPVKEITVMKAETAEEAKAEEKPKKVTKKAVTKKAPARKKATPKKSSNSK